MSFREIRLARNPECPACGERPTIRTLIDYEAFCGLSTGKEHAVHDAITASELRRSLEAGEDLQLIDVREPHEHTAEQIPGARLIPLGEIVRRRGELDAGRPAILYCKAGGRSAKAIQLLKEAGYGGPLVNLTGGIAAWADS